MQRFIICILGILYSLNVLADFENNCIIQGKRYCDQKLIQCFNKSECKNEECQICFDNQHACQKILYEECNLNDKQKECLGRSDNVCDIKLIYKNENLMTFYTYPLVLFKLFSKVMLVKTVYYDLLLKLKLS